MLSEEIPFEYEEKYWMYMPNVPPDEQCNLFWNWLPPLVEKIKQDLIALGRWDRQ